MQSTNSVGQPAAPVRLERPSYLRRSLALMKPITWFGPMWAFLCGAIASGGTSLGYADMSRLVLGVLMAGPILCGLSQIINDYFDREVDALNEPHRLIPSGLVSIQQIVGTIAVLLLVGVGLGIYLGPNVALLVGIGIVMALFYSAPPARAKRNGWVGNTLVAVSYEGLAWLAGHLAFASLTAPSLLFAALYSFGAHGIMSINDFKSMVGDRLSGINTIPVLHGEKTAAFLIIITMNLAQLGVLIAFAAWGRWLFVALLAIVLLAQIPQQRNFLRQPIENHLKFSAIGVSFFVWGMMIAAIGIRLMLGS